MKSKLYLKSEEALTKFENIVDIIQKHQSVPALKLVKELLFMYGDFLITLSNEYDENFKDKFVSEIFEIATGIGGMMSKILSDELSDESLEDDFGLESLN